MGLFKKKKIDLNQKYIYDPVLKAGGLMKWVTGKGARRVATALLFERIGKDERYAGAYPLLKGTFPIGEYCVLDTPKPYFMDVPGTKDYTPCKDQKLGKIVEIVKYAEDDYRVRGKLNQTYYREENIIVKEPTPMKDEMGNVITDEEGNVVYVNKPKINGSGEVVTNKQIVVYEEPMGVTIEGRDAIRIDNQTKNEIKEFKERNKSAWEKYGQLVVPVVIIAVAAMMFLFSLKFSHDNLVATVDDFKEASKANQAWWGDPAIIDKIGESVQRQQDEKKAPPVT